MATTARHTGCQDHLAERARLFELSMELACILDARGRFIEVNPALAEHLGYGRSELLGTRFLALVHPADEALAVAELDSLLEGAGRENFTHRYRHRSGTFHWLEWRAARDTTGLVYGVARDVTEVREKARALAESEERLRQIVEGAREQAIFMLDPDGRVETWNSGAQRLKGYTEGEIVGQHFSVFYTENDKRCGHPADVLRHARAGSHEEEGLRVRKDGSTFWANIVIRVVRDEKGLERGFVKMTRDFTERQRSREALEAREASLAASLKEREVLLQEVHHRVKNNLQVIASLMNMQLRKLSDPAARAALEGCQTRIHAIAQIHEKLYQSRDYASIPFAEYVRSLVDNILHAAAERPDDVRFELELAELSLPVDKAIPCGLVLNELVLNALKHAYPDKRGGRVRIEFGEREGGEVFVAVRDDGIGLPPCFDAARTRSLGMQLITTLTEQLDGRLEVSNVGLDGGTSVRVTFPLERTP